MKLFYSLALCLSLSLSYAQFNMTQLGHLDLVNIHNSDGNDIWAHVDNVGNEYAIMGLNDGTSIVDVTNPAAPVEIFFEPGMNSIWRDIKTYGDYAYVTTEAPNGLLIIDMSSLPNAAGITTTYYTGPSGDQWESAHNLYIDSVGLCYIFGANRDVGGCIILDIATNPLAPIELGKVEDYYAHDGVARGDTLYMGNINDGFMSMYDISNPANPILLGTQNTPGNFSHNVWFSDNSQYVFTTDEITNGFIGSYDVTDPMNMIQLDVIQSSPGDDVIPHNTHFINDYIVTSYYRDGVVIHDVSNPANMIEVANFDTSPLSGDGFNGCWGVYPWLPSGNIIASDIESGLYILGATYTRGCYLEGEISNITTSAPIQNADVKILSTTAQDFSDLSGDYVTGHAIAGTYTVEVSKFGYLTETVNNVVLTNGNTTVLDVQLTPIPSYTLTGNVISTGTGISGVQIVVENADTTYTALTDGNGDYIINDIFDGTYAITVGKWGYVTQCANITVAGASIVEDFDLIFGYYDDFSLDFGWTTSSSNATTGYWERADPEGTTLGGSIESNPEDDVTGDCGEEAYITGNGGGQAGTDDVDDGAVDLLSPMFDATLYPFPMVQFSTWWINAGGGGTGDDTLIVSLTDGTNTVELVSFDGLSTQMSQWVSHGFLIENYLTPTSTMQLIVHTADYGSGHIVEAGLDAFSVIETVGVNELEAQLLIYPNPFNDMITVVVDDEDLIGASIIVRDIQGKLILNSSLTQLNQQIELNSDLPSGVYSFELRSEKTHIIRKLVK